MRPDTRHAAIASPTNTRDQYSNGPVLTSVGYTRVSHSAENATARPMGTRTRPAVRCQPERRRRRPAENWKAPSSEYAVALTMWTIRATGTSGWWASCGMWVEPVDRSVSRTAPAATGTRDSETRAEGTRQV